MNIKKEITFESFPNLVFSLSKRVYVEIDGEKYHRNEGRPETSAFVPGDIEAVMEFVYEKTPPRNRKGEHPVVAMLRSFWTDDVVKAYQAEVVQPLTPDEGQP